MASITENIERIKASIPENVTLVAVSKTKPNEAILEAYTGGQRVFGENKAQEMAAKYEALPKDIEWHMIGHLQRNKVKYIAPFVALIHGVESLRLLVEINKQAEKSDRVIDCLLQIHIAKEATKFGLSERELDELLAAPAFMEMKNVRICGLMGMATYTEDNAVIEAEFATLAELFNKTKANAFSEKPHFKHLSMGMSSDYKMAIAEGSTMIRVGSSIFGSRVYS